ncbi:MAG TPA: ADP-forming succinate--CoA ligase subunit beta [Thermoleophilia bacterium]|nr:ADP-forming succinate--CoA ligase subunit beta [Thermoleophilia bacterium]
MDLFEHQGKELFAAAGIPVLPSRVVFTEEEAERAAAELGYPLAVKAQVLTGGRGKAGGVRVVTRPQELGEAVSAILRLIIKDKPVHSVLLEQGASVMRELYLAVTLDRHAKAPLLIFSARGGVDIELVAKQDPAALLRLPLDAVSPDCGGPRDAVVAAAALGDTQLDEQLGDLVDRLWTLYRERDASLVEVNPLAVVRDPARLVALDAKVTIDDNALYRQPDLAAQRPDEDARERAAREAGVTYLTLDGDVGVLGNGAGLVMSTLDMIGAAGGAAADFCDVGGGARAERIAAALDIITSDDRVRALLVNIFGGITRGDEVARGVLAWLETTGVDLPLVVRLDGNNAAEGLQLIAAAGIDGLSVTLSAQEAVESVVAAAKTGSRA